MGNVKLEVMANIIRNTFTSGWSKMYFYPNIPEKIYAKLFSNFDQYLNTNNVIAFCDTTLTHNSKNGIIFTLNGFYQQDLLEKPVYINYTDIISMDVLPNKKGEKNATDSVIQITYKENDSVSMLSISTSYEKENLKRCLEQLKMQYESWDDVLTFKLSGPVGNVELPPEQKKKCQKIIHTASVAAGGAGTGLSQIPLADTAVITPIQITMIISLAAVFGIRLTEGAAKGVLASASTSFVGRGVSQVLVGWIPFIGNAINTATAAGLTEAVGWMAASHFFCLQQEDKAKYKYEGMKHGYTMASEEFEIKYRKLAKEFINQQKKFETARDEYEELLKSYEKYIQELEEKIKNNDADFSIDYLNELKDEFEKLNNLCA